MYGMTFNCDCCGHFLNPCAPGVGWVQVPDCGPPISYGEERYRCVKCVERHGKPRPHQAVREDMCCGINPPNTELTGSKQPEKGVA